MQKVKRLQTAHHDGYKPQCANTQIINKVKNGKKDSYYKLEVTNKIADIPYDLFNINDYVNAITYPEHEFVYLLGASGEGKSIFASQLLLKILEKNYLANIKTNLYVFSLTKDALNKALKCADILKNMYPSLIPTWNSKSSPITISYTQDIENLIDDFNKMMRMGSNTDDVLSIFYFDDCVTVLSCATKETKNFFDNLASQGRQYKIFTIVSTQTTLRINKLLLNQIGTAFIVGPITYRDWEALMSQSTVNLLSSMLKRQQKEFYRIYFGEIGTKGSRNILVFQKKFQHIAFLQKCSSEYTEKVK